MFDLRPFFISPSWPALDRHGRWTVAAGLDLVVVPAIRRGTISLLMAGTSQATTVKRRVQRVNLSDT
jgi:hypothetical protein